MEIARRGFLVYPRLSRCCPHGLCPSSLRQTCPGAFSRFLSLGTWAPVLTGPEQPLYPSSNTMGTDLGSPCSWPHRINISPFWSKRFPQPPKAVPHSWPFRHKPHLTTRRAQALQSQGSPLPPGNFSIWPETETKDCYFPRGDKESSNLKNTKSLAFQKGKGKGTYFLLHLDKPAAEEVENETRLLNRLFCYLTLASSPAATYI